MASHFLWDRIIITNSLTVEEHQMTKYRSMLWNLREDNTTEITLQVANSCTPYLTQIKNNYHVISPRPILDYSIHGIHFLLQCKLQILDCCDSMMSYLHTQIERKKENNYFLVKMSISFQYNFSYNHMLVNIQRERAPEEVPSSKLVIPNVITIHKVQYTF